MKINSTSGGLEYQLYTNQALQKPENKVTENLRHTLGQRQGTVKTSTIQPPGNTVATQPVEQGKGGKAKGTLFNGVA